MRTRIKICGITRPEDADTAAFMGVDAIGLVFYERSPRRVDITRAAEIVSALPPFVDAVALFVDAPQAMIEAVIEGLPIDLLQFHGEERPDICRGFGLPYIKAVRMRDGVDLRAIAAQHRDAGALLLDTYREGVPGGTGASFRWQPLPADLGMPVILAGGLTPLNAAEAISVMRPYGVDVSGGVESARGVKDRNKLQAFVDSVARADNSLRGDQG